MATPLTPPHGDDGLGDATRPAPLATVLGRWHGSSAGGDLEDKSFFNNPQYHLQLTAAQHSVTITLAQLPSGTPHPMGVVVLESAASSPDEQPRRKTLGKPGGQYGYSAIKEVAPSPSQFSTDGHVSTTIKLERRDGAGYLIVPCTLDPGQEAAFSLEVASNFPVKLRLLPQRERKGDEPMEADDWVLEDQEEDEPLPTDADAIARLLSGLDDGSKYVDAGFEGDGALEGQAGPAAAAPWLADSLGEDEVEWLRCVDVCQSAPPVELAINRLAEEGRAGGVPCLGAQVLPGFENAIGAVATVACTPSMLKRVWVGHDQLGGGKRGIHALRLWRFDKWVTVLGDDRLPCASGRPLVGSCAEPEQLALAAIIKMLAKAAGSYASLRESRYPDLLVDLTGGGPQKIDVDGADKTWRVLNGLFVGARGVLVGCQRRDAKAAGGAAEWHVLLQVLSIGGERLICMRNPSGTPPASDNWGAGSREWLRTPHGSEGGPAGGGTMLEELSRSNTPFAAAAVRTDPRGVTWMSITDFVTMYAKGYACRVHQDSVPRAMTSGSWEAATAGGCLNHASWHTNPQYLLELSRAGAVQITMSQQDLGSGVHAAGVCILRSDGRRRLLSIKREDVLGTSQIPRTRHVTMDIVLPKSTPARPHMLVPFTFDPGHEGSFRVAAFAEGPLALTPALEWHHVALDGRWDASACGGCPNSENTGWAHNPQWLLPVTRPTTLTLMLELNATDEASRLGAGRSAGHGKFAIGCLLMHAAAAAGRKQALEATDVIARAGFLHEKVVSVRVELQPGSYAALPCTFDAGHHGSFTLHVYSDAAINPARLDTAGVPGDEPPPSTPTPQTPQTPPPIVSAMKKPRPGLMRAPTSADITPEEMQRQIEKDEADEDERQRLAGENEQLKAQLIELEGQIKVAGGSGKGCSQGSRVCSVM